jgi:hypothetical protein
LGIFVLYPISNTLSEISSRSRSVKPTAFAETDFSMVTKFSWIFAPSADF